MPQISTLGNAYYIVPVSQNASNFYTWERILVPVSQNSILKQFEAAAAAAVAAAFGKQASPSTLGGVSSAASAKE